MNMTAIIIALIFGAIGFVYFLYGRRQKNTVALFVSISLFILPYLITNVILLICVCVICMLVPLIVN